jgi:Protein of unknwon function (DUF3310)
MAKVTASVLGCSARSSGLICELPNGHASDHLFDATRCSFRWLSEDAQCTLRAGHNGRHECGGTKVPPVEDAVEHPAHYTSHPSGVECIQVTEHMNFNVGNAVKYLWRNESKGNRIEDLRKARWYVDREIARLTDDEQAN